MRNGDPPAPLQEELAPPQAQRAKQALKCIAVASGKGGVGKTAFTVNLAIGFSRLGQRVLLADSDFGLANADIMLGVSPEHTLQDAVFKGVPLIDVIVSTAYGVDLLAASSGARDLLSLGEGSMQMVVEELLQCAAAYDVLLFDCAAGISSTVISIIASVPQTVIVATPQPTSMVDAYALLKIIQQEKLTDAVNLVFNMVSNEEEGIEALDRLMGVVDTHLGMPVHYLGAIPQDEAMRQAIRARRPLLFVDPKNPAARQVNLMAKALLQQQPRTSRLEDLDAKGLLQAFLNDES